MRQLVKNRLSDNVGGVKHFSRTLQRALGEERHFVELTIIGDIFVVISLIAQSVYWIVVRRWTGWGIAMHIFVSAVLGFGLHTLLRVR